MNPTVLTKPCHTKEYWAEKNQVTVALILQLSKCMEMCFAISKSHKKHSKIGTKFDSTT